MLNIGFSVILIIILTGCLPIPAVYSSYYMPTYEDGKTRSPGCVGPKTKAYFDLPENVNFEVRTDNALGNTSVQYPIILHFRIPKGISFQFAEDTLRVEGSTPESKVVIQNKLRVESDNFHPDIDGLFDFDTLCPIDAKTIRENGQSINASLFFNAKVGEFKNDFPDRIELAFQPISIENKGVLFETLSLDSKQINQHKHYYMPIFKKTFEECTLHSETKECKDPGRGLWLQKAYTVSNEYFNLSGRVLRYENDPAISVSRMELMILTAKPWRLPIPVVKIIDKSSGKIYEGNPTSKNSIFECGSYIVPMTTRIHVKSDQAAQYSDVYIDGSIEKLQNKEITIVFPSVLINGKKFDLKPVKIYLKVLDAEILPFNC